MNRSPLKSSRAPLPAWLIAACLSALQGASGCGRAESQQIDSETHWLTSCQTDQDCAAGSCECGVCTEACVTSADCAGLGLAGLECVPLSGACGAGAGGAASSSAAACLLSCVDDADCAELGAGARCEGQRCERLALTGVEGGSGGSAGSGSSGGNSAVAGSGGEAGGSSANTGALCDGSEDIRFVWFQGGGFVSPNYSFTASRGLGFLAIDGQCRFWRSPEPGGIVYAGTLGPDDAAAFASTLDYERVLRVGTYEDPPACTDGGTNVIWTPESRMTCSCGPCNSNPSAPSGWTVAFRTMSDERLGEWFGSGRAMTGPARMVLMVSADSDSVLTWPLSREPRDNEFYYAPGTPVDESSGVEITDPDELSLLRAARATYLEREPGTDHTQLAYFTESSQSVFHMLLRDEVPAPVQAALRAASGVQ